MSLIIPVVNASFLNKKTFNWPIVGFLLFMTAIPSVPAIFILALVVLGPAADGSIPDAINALYFEKSAAILVHGSSGILFFLTMPFQFSPALRGKNSSWHKAGGRIALLSGYVLAASGVWMHHVLAPNSLDMRYWSLVVMSMAMCTAFSLALLHILNRNVQAHHRWMIRAVAITLASITPLFVEAIVYLLFGQFESLFAILSQFQHDFGRLVGIVISLAVVEFVFLMKRSNR